MKEYRFTKRFDKQFAKLPIKKQDAVENALLTYLDAPETPSLRRHPLKGEYQGQVSISADGDLRIHLLEDDEFTTVVVCVGSHSQLYR